MPRDRLQDVSVAQDEVAIEMDSLETDPTGFMQSFFKSISCLREGIDNIEKNTAEIQEIHSKALAAYQSKKDQESSQRLDDLMHEISVSANRIRNELKVIDQKTKEMQDTDPSSVPARIRSSQHATISRRFIEVMDAYNVVQSTYKNKYRERIKRQFKIVNMDVTTDVVDKILDGERSDAIFAEQILSQSTEEEKQRLEDIQDRHKDIVKLEKSIQELHELFMDMAMLVSRQGEMINQIEFQVGSAEGYTEEATTELKSARRLQTSARKKKICLISILLIGLVVIAIILIAKYAR